MDTQRTPKQLILVLLAAHLGIAATSGGQEISFFEPFTWRGPHAATIAAQTPAMIGASPAASHDCAPAAAFGAHATTVWWESDVWDVRGDTAFPAVSPPATGYHVDVHRAVSADPTDGREDNTVYAIGGDGSPGVAAMRMDFQGISSARLRNPMLISAARPGVVSFYATKFLTTAHWWEIAITPTATVAGAEQTAVPEVNDPLEGPLVNASPTPGPGHRPALDSINLIGTGSSDVPCDNGWSTRFAVTKSIGGATADTFNPVASYAQLLQTDPAEIEELYLWRLEYRPDRIDLLADLDRNGTPEPLESFAVTIPWSEVHVHFMAVTYQADHHPQGACYLGSVREFVWRHLSVAPVKYERTLVFPKEFGTTNLPRATGWLFYDLRDIQRFGPPVSGVAQANPAPFELWGSVLACSQAALYCPDPVSSYPIEVEIPAAGLAGAERAQLIYDIRSPLGPGVAILKVNGVTVGTMPGKATVPGSAQSDWAHRSLDIPPGLLHAGVNQVEILMSGNVELDRLQIEISIAAGRLFADGFESGDTSRWSSASP
jgi:hypothetical protein